MNYLFASTNFGTEKMLGKELLDLGVEKIDSTHGGVYYQADELLLYKTLMWSRIASRIFLCIKRFSIYNIKDLYNNVYNIEWNDFFYTHNTFLINFKGTNNIIRNSLFGSLTVKDAIVDKFKKNFSSRPNVDLINPNIRIRVCLYENNKINVMLDLSGDALHKRGYRRFVHATPIKENLSVAAILQSGWKHNTPIIDPMCGSGTLVIEAAMIACNRAPGLNRLIWGFQFWKGYKKDIWEKIYQDAEKKFQIGIKLCSKNYFLGYDYNAEIIKKAKINALYAGVSKITQFFTKNLNNLKNIYNKEEIGTLLSNAPYGERNHTESQLVGLYIQLGIVSKKYFHNWTLSIFSASKFLLQFIQMRANQEYCLKNGALNCFQNNYHIYSNQLNIENKEYQNRLKKNVQKLEKWKNIEKIECFRIYNADLPNYNIIIDIYKKWMVVQEYQAPNIINFNKTHKRLCHAIYYAKEILSIEINNIILKIRKKNKNHAQYSKLFQQNNFIQVKEYSAKFLINLVDYLDTGLFLEKRLIRKLIGNMSKGKDFLNLFSYTGTATVYAGLGQAKSTTSIDISKTYITWSKRNMFINNLNNNHQHHFIQTDCVDWIKNTNKKFDLIFINPPTFSNSKKMKKHFDIKKDYLNLIKNLKSILRKNGSIIFSSSTHNFNFQSDEIKKIQLYAKNITKKMQCKDYINDSNLHHSWIIKHLP
ncbi:bifunctional 23S rRNA (guanine(2069)-N(7))-methyltransferase RlmK/23S rRNA (guanine(2445)-N(2))-methyltransferase RlmL [Buchnera aphidicola (Hyadaphis tataricae)]|uniref:Ribosomal RNA large subunit methyltransferase K/L n=1 Tax=Buchnera aphidicola (Hyadaphis tataricae) TaxID=1241859 RepID=A0A4D6XW07_9GAMM|nr:bifunctional 23S rRNA (guanine(2069)-N(7))-methyltransferase RlmK/23S rRNA (guanine(2445)-N(2))-methyltransferase RlmL [Buchnera aphidicola]QCI21656.1 bifunctional 23S rRNA (guanine(2069)-N(7))-methyltransferase RlmK/23S rRNA (guanine(2445)-N(2))-methyltransferase RlmL [Buchnera aphidicola (Hyadaphis tataricae)]